MERVTPRTPWQRVARAAGWVDDERKQEGVDMSNSPLIDHAEREMRLAGLFDNDADYGGALPKQVLDLMRVFAGQGHSGYSAMMTLDLFSKLAQFKTLTPITDAPDDWNDVSEMSGQPMWQSKRSPSVFSRDGGQTWYDLDTR